MDGIGTQLLVPARTSPTLRSLRGLVASMGSAGFAERALAELNIALSAASWAVYRRFADRPPVLHLSASHGIADTTRDCFAVYRDAGLYRRDRILDAVRMPSGQVRMLRMHASEAPNADHRDAIYVRHGMVERLSVVAPDSDGSVLAVNLYHHSHQGSFSEGEVANFAELAPLLLDAVVRHLELCTAAPATSLREALRARCAALTERELDVLERLLAGMTYDGIAADIGLSLATVKTYRARAFERLGMHFKSELFAAFLPGGRASL